jgi:hypothetical protein
VGLNADRLRLAAYLLAGKNSNIRGTVGKKFSESTDFAHL